MADTFECANCHEVYERGWSDAEAYDEMLDTISPQVFADDPHDPVLPVCDPCYQGIMSRIRAEAPELLRPEAR